MTAEDNRIIKRINQTDTPIIIVINKVDLSTQLTESEINSLLPNSPPRLISALTGQGIQSLKEVLQTTVTQGEAVSSADKIFITNIRHAELLNKALHRISAIEKQLAIHESPEIIAAELREALSYLGEILGTNITADLLDRIFSSFCIGK